MAHLLLVPKQDMTDDLSLSNQSYQDQDEQGIYDQVSNNGAYEDTNLVFIAAADQDLGFEFEDVNPLDLETAAEVEEEQEKVPFTGEEEDPLMTVSMDPCSSNIVPSCTNYGRKIPKHTRTRSQKKYISDSSSSAINNGKNLQSKPRRSPASSTSLLSIGKKRPYKVHKQFECNWPERNAKCSNAYALRSHTRIRKHLKIHESKKKQLHTDTAVICTGTPHQEKVIKIEMDPHDLDDSTDEIEDDQQPEESLQFKPRGMRTIHKKSFACNWSNCNAKLTTKYGLTIHKRIHTGEKPYICDWKDCKQRFLQSGKLQTHRKNVHNIGQPFICDWPECNAKRSSSSALKRHKQIHTREKPFICDLEECGQRFSYPYSLKNHKRTHAEEKPFICDSPNCGRRFTQSQLLKTHKKDIHNIGEPFICDWPECNVKLVSSSTLKRHKQLHTVEKPYHCPWPNCNLQFRRRDYVKKHLKVHESTKKQIDTGAAAVCSTGTVEQGTVIKIAMDPHDDDDGKISTDADNKLTNKIEEDQQPEEASLQSKPRRRRTIYKTSFACNWPNCNAKLSTPYGVTLHKRIHTGEKPYICDWKDCKQRFTQSSKLQAHKKNVHNIGQPFICDWPECNAKLSSSSAVKRHKKTHTGEKPFICDWPDCKQRFIQSSHLISHKRNHTGEKPYVCDWPDCNGQRRFSTLSGLKWHKRSHNIIVVEQCEQDIVKVELDPFELNAE